MSAPIQVPRRVNIKAILADPKQRAALLAEATSCINARRTHTPHKVTR